MVLDPCKTIFTVAAGLRLPHQTCATVELKTAGNDLIVKPCTESRMMVYSNLFKHDPGWARHSSYARAGRYFTKPRTNHFFRLCIYSFGAPSDGFLEVEWVRAFCSRFVEIYFPSCAKRSIIDAFMPL